MHTAPRMIVVGDAASRWLVPDNSLVAGCFSGVDLAKLLLYPVLDHVHNHKPNLRMSQIGVWCSGANKDSQRSRTILGDKITACYNRQVDADGRRAGDGRDSFLAAGSF